MLNRAPGDLNKLVNRPRVLEDVVGGGYPEYKYLMFSVPILLNAKIVVETGLGTGVSSRIHLEALSFMKPPRELHTYELRQDEYFGLNYKQVEKDIKALNLPAEWNVHYMDSVQGGKEWSGGKIEYLYLDSDHAYSHVMNELYAWYPHLADRCFVMTDDTWCENTPHAACTTKNPGECPMDTYWAFHDFASTHKDFTELNFSYPQGKSILYRNL